MKLTFPMFDKLTPRSGVNVTIAQRDVRTTPVIAKLSPAKPSIEDDKARASRLAAIERERLAKLRVELLSRSALGRAVLERK